MYDPTRMFCIRLLSGIGFGFSATLGDMGTADGRIAEAMRVQVTVLMFEFVAFFRIGPYST